jgi:hypothetical protein
MRATGAILFSLFLVAGCGNSSPGGGNGCAAASDCSEGGVCKNGQCGQCVDVTDDALCGAGKICNSGACVPGSCHKVGDCTGGQVCKGNVCTGCTDGTDDGLCGMGKVCSGGKCVPGSCHTSADCGDLVCKGSTCTLCTDGTDDALCGMGKICVSGKCVMGTCHQTSDCSGGKGEVCKGNLCVPCDDGTDDGLCGMGKICVGGACTTGDCHTADDCPPAQRCLPAGNLCSAYGTGSDGPLTVAANGTKTFESLTAIAAVTAIAGPSVTAMPATGFNPGDDVLLINLQGSATDQTSTGNYELLTVTSIANGVFSLVPPPAKSYGNQTDNKDFTGQKVFLVRVPNFTDVTVDGALTANAWSGMPTGLGLIVFRASGTVTVSANGRVDTSSLGFVGQGTGSNGISGVAGESIAPTPAKNCFELPGSCPNFGGGGGGVSNCDVYSCTQQQLGAGGGGGGYGAAGAPGAANGNLQMGGKSGQAYGDPMLGTIFLGSGGGGGAGGVSGPGQATSGGRGGGLVLIFGNTISVAGAVHADGQTGSTNNNCGQANGSGSGGGGAGGSVYLVGKNLTLANTTANGGPASCKGGGPGGVGRVRVDYGNLNGQVFPNGSAAVTTPPAFLGMAP